MEKRYIMGIDQGTTGTRAVLFDRQGAPCSSAYKEIQQIYRHPGWVEHDAMKYYETVMECAQKALLNANASAADIEAIGITCQRETTILWDKDTGEPLCPAIVWQSRQSAKICERFKEKGCEEYIKQHTGLPIDAYFSASKIKWMMENEPAVKQKMDEDKVLFGNVDSWLIYKLTGGAVHAEDYSNASRTLLLDIKSLEWDQNILDMLQIKKSILPKLVPSSGVIAYTSKDVFFGQQIPIAGDAGDQQAALFGQACFSPGMAKNTYGTALAVLMNTGQQFIASDTGLMTDVAWVTDNNLEYALEGLVYSGGATVQWLRDGLKLIKTAAESEKKAASVPDTGGVYLVPAFTGLCAPYWDMYARGTIVGITRGTTDNHIIRSALESIAYQTRDLLECMQKDAGVKTQVLRVDGGATANNFLMQFQADILGIPLQKPVVTEMTALGAAYLAGLGTGFWKDRGEIEKQWKIERTYEPDMSEDERETLYEGWKKSVQRSLGWAK